MQQFQTTISANTSGLGLYDITRDVLKAAHESGITTGQMTLFIQHTSASLTIQENADPTVQDDLVDALDRIAPMDNRLYRHTCEGPDDMPAHIKSALTDTTMTIPVAGGRPVLGTWQGIYIAEHRKHPHTRRVVIHIIGK